MAEGPEAITAVIAGADQRLFNADPKNCKYSTSRMGFRATSRFHIRLWYDQDAFQTLAKLKPLDTSWNRIKDRRRSNDDISEAKELSELELKKWPLPQLTNA